MRRGTRQLDRRPVGHRTVGTGAGRMRDHVRHPALTHRMSRSPNAAGGRWRRGPNPGKELPAFEGGVQVDGDGEAPVRRGRGWCRRGGRGNARPRTRRSQRRMQRSIRAGPDWRAFRPAEPEWRGVACGAAPGFARIRPTARAASRGTPSTRQVRPVPVGLRQARVALQRRAPSPVRQPRGEALPGMVARRGPRPPPSGGGGVAVAARNRGPGRQPGRGVRSLFRQSVCTPESKVIRPTAGVR